MKRRPCGVPVVFRPEEWNDLATDTSTRKTPNTPDTPPFPISGVACMVNAYWVEILRSRLLACYSYHESDQFAVASNLEGWAGQ